MIKWEETFEFVKVASATVLLSDLDPSLPSVFMTHSGLDGGC